MEDRYMISESKFDQVYKERIEDKQCIEEKDIKNDNNDIDILVKKYIHDIKNSKSFDKNSIIKMNNLPYEERIKILEVYNEMIKFFSSFFE